jgi:hypothetical protein
MKGDGGEQESTRRGKPSFFGVCHIVSVVLAINIARVALAAAAAALSLTAIAFQTCRYPSHLAKC